MQQVVDLQNDLTFQDAGTALVSIAFDSAEEQAPEARQLGITVPMLIDADRSVSTAYDVLKWAARTGEPSHTFVLVNAEGKIAWIQDYGAAENGGRMYVPIEELNQSILASLNP
jgi:peroxiredoxin